MAAWRLTNPIITIKYPMSTVVNTSKKASAHMCITIHRQKSAITKFVLGVAIKPETNNIIMLNEAYTSQFGNSQGCFIFNTGFTPRYNAIAHNTNTTPNIICHTFPSSTYSQPWFPNQYQFLPVKRPMGPNNIPTNEPAVKITVSQKILLMSFTCPDGCFGEMRDIIKKEAPIQHAEIQIRDN